MTYLMQNPVGPPCTVLGRHPPRPEPGRGRGLAGHDRLLPQRWLRGGRVGPQGGVGVERAERHGAGPLRRRDLRTLQLRLQRRLFSRCYRDVSLQVNENFSATIFKFLYIKYRKIK